MIVPVIRDSAWKPNPQPLTPEPRLWERLYSFPHDIQPNSRNAAAAANCASTNPARCPSSNRFIASNMNPPAMVKYHQANMRVRRGFFISDQAAPIP